MWHHFINFVVCANAFLHFLPHVAWERLNSWWHVVVIWYYNYFIHLLIEETRQSAKEGDIVPWSIRLVSWAIVLVQKTQIVKWKKGSRVTLSTLVSIPQCKYRLSTSTTQFPPSSFLFPLLSHFRFNAAFRHETALNLLCLLVFSWWLGNTHLRLQATMSEFDCIGTLWSDHYWYLDCTPQRGGDHDLRYGASYKFQLLLRLLEWGCLACSMQKCAL